MRKLNLTMVQASIAILLAVISLAVTVTHTTIVATGDQLSAALWNANHTITGSTPAFTWKSPAETALILDDQGADVPFTDCDLTATTSATANYAIIRLRLHIETVGTGSYCAFGVRKNGSADTLYPILDIKKLEATAGDNFYETIMIGLDAGQVLEYMLTVGAGWIIDAYIHVLAYGE